MRRLIAFVGFLVITGGIAAFYHYGRSIWVPVYQEIAGKRSTAEVVERLGQAVDKRLLPAFESVDVKLSPPRIVLIGLKEEKRLELWAEKNETWVLVKRYEVKASSGRSGPKLKEGDRQVPEGLYRIEGLNPNSSYHLSIKVNYPNEFDRQQAVVDGRTRLGGDIYIHGKDVSIGCLAMGDEAIEELFVLVSRVGIRNASIIIAPWDFRSKPRPAEAQHPAWITQLYANIANEMSKYRQ